MNHCPQCGVPRGQHHKMSCSEPGGRKGEGPVRPFGEEIHYPDEDDEVCACGGPGQPCPDCQD